MRGGGGCRGHGRERARARVGRTVDAGDDESGKGGIGDYDERGKVPEVLSVEEKTLCCSEPQRPPCSH